MGYYKKPLPKFSDEAVWQELKRQCYDGTIEYEDFPADEYKYFDQLRLLYLKYKFAGMPKDEALRRELQLACEYEQSKEADKIRLKVYKEYQDNVKRFELLKIKVNKADDPMEKLAYALEIIGIVTGDNIFKKINLK